MRIGIIGTGTMGGMLARAFATCSNVDVSIYNRSPAKAADIVNSYPKIQLRQRAEDVAVDADVTFVCTKATDGSALMEGIGHSFRPDQTIVTTISTIPLAEWEVATPARVAIAIPSITQTERSGVLLVCYGSRFDEPHRAELSTVLQNIATPFAICEPQVRVCADLTSCGPAFIAFLLLEWAEAASRTGQLTTGDAEFLLSKTLMGTADLLKAGFALRDITHKVCVPGGMTEAGVAFLGATTPSLFDGLHEATHGHAYKRPSPSGISQLNHASDEKDDGEAS